MSFSLHIFGLWWSDPNKDPNKATLEYQIPMEYGHGLNRVSGLG
jgi:hypothetical protein